MARFDVLREIERLNPVTDHQRIVHLSFGYEFPWVSTRDLFASWFPRIAMPIVRYSIYAMLDEAMITSFGFPKPLPLTRPLLRSSLKLRGRAVRWLPPRKTAHFFTDNRNRTHPDGYDISRLGPPKLVAADEKRAKSEV